MSSDTTSLALLIQLLDADHGPRLNAAVVEVLADTTPRRLLARDDVPHPLADLACWQYLDDRDGRAFHGWDTAYRDVHRVDAATAKLMHTTLMRLTRRLDAVARAAGPAESFSAHVIRVGAALGVTRFIRRVGDSGGPRWQDSMWRLGTADDLPSWLEALRGDYCAQRGLPWERAA